MKIFTIDKLNDDIDWVDVAIDLDFSPGAVRVAKCVVLKRLRPEFGALHWKQGRELQSGKLSRQRQG
jgi:hypothetical protein